MDTQFVLQLFKAYDAAFLGMPEMTGLDWAMDHGWIEREEWENANRKADEMVKNREELGLNILGYRKRFQVEFDDWLLKMVAIRLQHLAAEEHGRLRSDMRDFMKGDLAALQLTFLVRQVLLADSKA